MKKGKLLLLMLLCCMLTACKDDKPNVEDTETEIEGVEQISSLFNYSYEEQSGGVLLFSIEGQWNKNLSWVLDVEGEKVAKAKEVSQNSKTAKFQFTPENKKGGYSDFEIVLCDKKTKEVKYNCMLSLILSEDGKSVSFLNVYFEEATEVESESTENTEGSTNTENSEELSSEEKELQQKEETAFHKVVGELVVPTEFDSVYKSTSTDQINGTEIKVGSISFTYKEKIYMCIVSPTMSLSDFVQDNKLKEEHKQVKVIKGTEVCCYEEKKARYIMWVNSDGIRYVLSEKKATDDGIFEVAELLIK